MEEIFDEIGESLDTFGKELIDGDLLSEIEGLALIEQQIALAKESERLWEEESIRQRLQAAESQRIRDMEYFRHTRQHADYLDRPAGPEYRPLHFACECGTNYVYWVDYIQESDLPSLEYTLGNDYAGSYNEPNMGRIREIQTILHCIKCGRLARICGKVMKVEIKEFNL